MTNIEKYGFRLVRSAKLNEINATLYEMMHEKSGASLVYLDRDDDNMTFSIGFATPPTDDTGVFHIIEHSVLCGSKKYPLNDPFAELLKGSLNTFLNAMTYEDRTIYPVSSRCERDFLNLVDVYMDAVFSPNMLNNPSIFRQEGWHYEYDEDSGKLSYNGVVYNEMKGAYSSPDELGGMELNRILFGGTAYGCDSGGYPTSIPSLTYEQFKATHEKHYHPSNSKIFLDGKIDLDKLLPLLDSHLNSYNRREPISLKGKSTPKIHPPHTIKYEISENEDEKGKARVLYGYVCSSCLDNEAQITLDILCDILCGSNASPLKKAILDLGLAKDVAMYLVKSRENTLVIELRDVDEGRFDEIDRVIEETIRATVKNGIEKDKIKAKLNSIEFRHREMDFGALPTGIVFAMSVYGIWMHGGDPEKALLINDVISSVKDKIDIDHFEKALYDSTIGNNHKAKLIMLPDKTLGERNSADECAQLDAALKAMSEEELRRIKKEEKDLRMWQQTEPTDEELDSLPKLSLSDIPKKSSRPSARVTEQDDVKILTCPIKTNGIVYITLLFDASDLEKEELINLSMLSSALLNFPTEHQDALSLQNDIKANLGNLFASFTVGERSDGAIPYLKIGTKALKSKSADIIRLVREVLLTSKIDNPSEIGRIVAQAKSHMDDSIISSGESVALGRLQAGKTEAGAIAEYLAGYEAYRILKNIDGNEEKIANLTKNVANLLKKLVDKKRLTLSVAGDLEDGFIESLISIFPENEKAEKKITPICAGNSEYFLLPSKVAYAVTGGKSERVGENLGIMRVARSILSYEYLWNTVRVQSGAYGTGFVPRRDGTLSFYSYRDPAPARSLGFYKASADYLRSLVTEQIDITKFIIGAIGEYDTLITPRTATTIATADYLNGWTADDDAKVRQDMLNMTTEDLNTVADIIDEVLMDGSTIIVGGQEHLDTLTNKPESIIVI